MKVGISSMCITPGSPVWMGGFGGRTKRSEGKYQDIFLKAMALEDSKGHRAVFVTSDLLAFSSYMVDPIKDRAHNLFGLNPSELLLNASHSHSGPLLRARDNDLTYPGCDEEYSDEVINSALDAIGRSLHDLEEARLFWAKGICPMSISRRRPLKGDPGKVDESLLPNPLGVTNPDVPVLKVLRSDDSLKAILFLYACHPSTVSGYLLGGDYSGFTQRYLEDEFHGATALFLQGCGGDLKPRNIDPSGHFKLGSIAELKRFGRQLSQAVLTALVGDLVEIDGRIRTMLSSVKLPLQPIPSRRELKSLAEGKDWRGRKSTMILQALDEGVALPDCHNYTIQLISIGDAMSFLGLAGEVCVDYSLRFKRQLGERVWVLGYCNDGWCTYIPSARMIPEGGYEVERWLLETRLPMPFTSDVESIIAGKVGHMSMSMHNR